LGFLVWALSRRERPTPIASGKLNWKNSLVIKKVGFSRDVTSATKQLILYPFYSAESGLSFSSFIRKLEKKNNPEYPVNPV